MTEHQLYGFLGMYLAFTVAVAVLTRATLRRMAGAVGGAAVCGPAVLAIVALAERAGWWHFTMRRDAYFLALFCVCIAFCGFVFLLTWRVARRFGGAGLGVLLVAGAVLGPVRDSWYMSRFPEWGSYAPGVAPMLVISATYVVLGILGHGTMRLIAGPASADRLARRLWER